MRYYKSQYEAAIRFIAAYNPYASRREGQNPLKWAQVAFRFTVK